MLLYGVTAFVCGNRKRCYIRSAIGAVRKTQNVVRRVVIVREMSRNSADVNASYALTFEYHFAHFVRGPTLFRLNSRVFLKPRIYHYLAYKRENKPGNDYYQGTVNNQVKHISLRIYTT